MILGLAGKSCSGKNMLIPVFEAHGFAVLDADQYGHAALEANSEAILKRFQTTQRSALAKIVFANDQALRDLEAIVHPWITQKIKHDIQKLSATHFVINAAILHKTELALICDAVIWVQAPLWQRFWRARRRDRLSGWRIFQRIWAQRKLTPHAFAPNVDILMVENRAEPSQARRDLDRHLERMLDRFSERG